MASMAPATVVAAAASIQVGPPSPYPSIYQISSDAFRLTPYPPNGWTWPTNPRRVDSGPHALSSPACSPP
jgi:hypothetical protein